MDTDDQSGGSSAEAAGGGREDRWLHALVGAVVTVVTVFIPLSPVLGGGVAGYLHTTDDREGLRIGALSGVIATVPLLAVLGLVVLVMVFGVAVTGEVAGPLFVVLVLLVIAAFVLLYTVALSAVGGLVGAAIAASNGGTTVEGEPEDGE